MDNSARATSHGGTLLRVDHGIARLLEAQGGVSSTRELERAGMSRHAVADAVRRGELVRVRRDAVVLAASLSRVAPWERRALITRAVGHSLARGGAPGDEDEGGSVHALSHASALTVHGLPTYGEADVVHLCRTDGARGRRDGTVWVHRPVDPEWTTVVDGLRVVTPVLAALQVAATDGPEPGLVALDGVLHDARERDRRTGGTTEHDAALAEVARVLEARLVGRSRATRQVVELADGRSESVGESRSRWLLHLLGLGPWELQHEVRDESGQLVGVADLKLVGHAVLLEFDGQLKYDDRRDLVAEKLREDRIRALGYEFVRLVWADLERPQHVRQRVLEALDRAVSRRRRPA